MRRPIAYLAVLVGAAFFFSHARHADAAAVFSCGRVKSSRTWEGVVNVDCSVTVPKNVTLTIDPSSELSLPRAIVVEGKLVIKDSAISGLAGIRVSSGGRLEISGSTLNLTRIDLAGGASAGSVLRLDGVTTTNSKITAGAAGRTAGGTVAITNSSFSSSPLTLFLNKAASITDSTFSSSPLKIVGSNPVVTRNSFVGSLLTLGDNGKTSPVTDSSRITGNSQDSDSGLVLNKVKLAGEITAPEVTANGTITVGTGASASFSGSVISGPASWVVNGSLTLNGGSFSASGLTVQALKFTDPPSALSVSNAEVTSPVTLGGGVNVLVESSTLSSSRVSSALVPASPTRATDSVEFAETSFLSSPVSLKRQRNSLIIDPFNVAFTARDSSFASSPVDVWSQSDIDVQRNTFSASATRLVGGAPTVVSNTFTSSPLTLGDTVTYALTTDLSNVSVNTSTPSNTVTVGRVLLGGSLEGLNLVGHLEATLLVPSSREVTLSNTTISGAGTVVVNGSLSVTNSTISATKVFVGAASAAAPRATLAVTGSTLETNVLLSGNTSVEIATSTLSGSYIQASTAPNIPPMSSDSVSVTDSTLSQTQLLLSRVSRLEFPASLTFARNAVTGGKLEVISQSPVSVTDSTWDTAVVTLVGGSPTLSGNEFSATSTVTVGETAQYAPLTTSLEYVDNNQTTPSNTGAITLGKVSLTTNTKFTGFSAVVLPTAWSTLTIDPATEITLSDITLRGPGSLRVHGSLITDNVALRQNGLFVGALSGASPSASAELRTSTLATNLTLDGGASVIISESNVTDAVVKYANSPAIARRDGDGVVITGSNLTRTTVSVRRYSPSLLANLVLTIDASTLTSSSVTAWSSSNVAVRSSTLDSTALILVGGTPVVADNLFAGTGSTTFGDTVSAITESTNLSSFSNNTVLESAAASTKTLVLGRVSLGSLDLDGASGFATVKSTTRDITVEEGSSASIKNASITGSAAWLVQGSLSIDSVIWATPRLETRNSTGRVTLSGSSLTQGSVNAGYLGIITASSTLFDRTALNAGSPSVVYPSAKAPTAGRLELVSAVVNNATLTSQANSTLVMETSTLANTPITVHQGSSVSLASSSLDTSPVTSVKSSLEVSTTTLLNSKVSLSSGTLALRSGTRSFTGQDGTGVSAVGAAVTIAGSALDPVVLSGVCDPLNAAQPASCATKSSELRPGTLVALNNLSSISATHAVFALAHTGIAADPTTKGASQTELSSTTNGVFESDFVLTDNAVTFQPNWSATACRFDAYLPVVDTYFHLGHDWNTVVTPYATNGFTSYSAGTADYSGFMRGQIVEAFSSGKWLSSLTGNTDHQTWEIPSLITADYGSLILQALSEPAAHNDVATPEFANMLPYYAQTCAFPVPTKPVASSIGIPVAAPRLTTPVVPWSSTDDEVLPDGVESPVHEHAQQVADHFGSSGDRLVSEFLQSPIPVLAFPHSDLQRVYADEISTFEPQLAPQIGPLTLTRLAPSDPVLQATWGAPASSRVLGYHVELSRDGATWERLTPSLGLPGKHNTMHRIACSFETDCHVRIVVIGWDGEGTPSDVVIRPKAPWIN